MEPVYLEACGTPQLDRYKLVLEQLGYRKADRLAAPGDYRYESYDAAPGWGDYQYWIGVIPLPGFSLRDINEREAALAPPGP